MLPYKSSSHSAKCVCCASLRSGGRRLAVRIAMGCQIGVLPCTPFASSRRSPQGETRSMERTNRESYISCTIPQFPPLVVNAVSQSPECVSCHMTQKVNSRNADFISIARRAIRNPRPEGPSNLRTFRPKGPVHPKNPFPQPFYTTRRRQAAITFGPKARQPSHRRCVQRRQPPSPFEPGPQSGPYFLLFLHFSYRIML